MSSEVMLSPISGTLGIEPRKDEISREDISILILCFTSDEEWMYAGEISKGIKDGTGAYLSPDLVEKRMRGELKDSVVKIWTQSGNKYRRMKDLFDYM